MRLGLHSYNPIVWALEALGILPEPVLVGFWGMETSRVLIAAVELGVFDALAEKPRTAAELAGAYDYDETGTTALLNALNGFGYLKRRDGVYSLRRRARRWLTSDARYSMVRPFGLYRVLWDELGDLEERIRSGGARDFHADRDDEFWRRYEVGLGEFARLTAPMIARKVKLDAPLTRLLDLGGGHGMYSAAFCRRYPGLHATVLDLPPACEVGRRFVAEMGLSDRIEHRDGDLMSDEWGDGWDVVLIFNVLHVLAPGDAAAAIAKAHAALRPGGTLVVVDSVHRQHGGNIDAVGGGSELLFYAINNTASYPEERILEWVRDAGFERVTSSALLAMPEAVITAQRPRG